jgi:hypothetical protein
MACDLSAGRLIPCKDVVGGLDAVYFINYDDVTGYTYDVTNTDVIETITGGGTINAYKYDLKGDSSFEQTITSDRNNGTTMIEQTLNLMLTKQDLATHKQVKLLTFGRPRVIIKDRNGNYFVCGLAWGAEVTGGAIASGAAMGDKSGYSITLVAQEKIAANFMEATDDAGLATAGLTVVTG